MQSDVDRKLMSWRASARSKPDLEEFNDILSDMQWERVLEASVSVDFKLKLWKSKSMMKERRFDTLSCHRWNLTLVSDGRWMMPCCRLTSNTTSRNVKLTA